MTERGRVREIKGDLITVIPDISASCFGCMKMECKSRGSLLKAENPKSLPLEPGQTVELRTPDASIAGQSILWQSITALLPPALGFTAGFSLTRLFFPETGEGAAAFIGVILLFLAAFIVYKIRKKIPAKEHLRYVERIVG